MNLRHTAYVLMILLATPIAAETIAITGGTVHTLGSAGTLENATVLIEDGSIRAVGSDIAIPEGARRFHASGKVVTPGLFESVSQVGLVEVSLETSTRDHTASETEFTADFDITWAINPRSTLIPINRIEGLTRTMVAPRGSSSPMAGRGAIIHLGGVRDYIVKTPAALFVDLGERGASRVGDSRAAALLSFDRKLTAATRLSEKDAEEGESAEPEPDLEALAPVLAGEMPVAIAVNRASDIEIVLRLAEKHGFRAVILGGDEAWLVASSLAQAEVPVVLDPLANLPTTFESLGASLENAARLHAAGVTIALTSGDTHNIRNLKQAAGNAVRNGLPWEAALAAVTSQPAKIWGINATYGSLEPGKDADVVIWDGDPLEVTTYADHVFIQGQEIPMVSRQTRLRDRYLKLDRELPHAYSEP